MLVYMRTFRQMDMETNTSPVSSII